MQKCAFESVGVQMNDKVSITSRRLPTNWDTKRINQIVQQTTTEERFIDSEGKIKEPFGSIVFLRLIGQAPVRGALILNILSQKKEWTTRSELAKALGIKYGKPYVRIGEWLESLAKIGLLEQSDIRPFGKREMKAYRLKETELNVFCQNVHNFLCGKEFEWSLPYLLKIVKDRYAKMKIEDFDGTLKRLDFTRMIESIIRAGESLEVAAEVAERILKETDECRDLQSLRKKIVEELENRKSWEAMEAYLKANPIGMKLVGGTYDGRLLTYEISREILLKHVSGSGITGLTSKVCREVLHPTLRSLLNEIRLKQQVNEGEVCSKIDHNIFSVYRETLADITQDPSKFIRKSKLFLESAREKAGIDKPNEAISFLLPSFHFIMRSLYLHRGLLPPENEIATIYLTKSILSPNCRRTEEVQIEPKKFGKEIRKSVSQDLKQMEMNSDKFQKYFALILPDPRAEPPKIKKRDMEFLLAFVQRLISTVENRILAAHKH